MMAKGGARNRSRVPDPNSARSERRGISFSALPSEGFKGRVPKFPLPDQTAREADVWKWAWRTPQAVAWDREPWRWRSVALWVRWSVQAESPECSASILAQVIRLADQIGFTPAGLKENGWRIAEDEVAARAAARPTVTAAAVEEDDPRRRLRRVDGGTA